MSILLSIPSIPQNFGSTPTGIQSGKWKTTFTPNVPHSSLPFVWHYIIQSAVDGASIVVGGPENPGDPGHIGVYNGAYGQCVYIDVTFAASANIELVVDLPLQEFTVSGLLTGNGTYAFAQTMAFGSGAINVGSDNNYFGGVYYGAPALPGTLSNFEDFEAQTYTVALGGTGTLEAVGTAAKHMVASLSGPANELTATIQSIWNATTAMTAAGALTAAIHIGKSMTVAMNGTGTLAGAVTNSWTASASLWGIGALAGAVTSLWNATTPMTGVGTLTSNISAGRFASCAMSGHGTVEAYIDIPGPHGVMNGVGTLAAVGTSAASIEMSTIGVGTLAAVGTRLWAASISSDMSGVGTLTASRASKVEIEGVSTLIAIPHVTVSMSGSSALIARQIAFGIQDNSFNLLGLPSYSQMLGWQTPIAVQEELRLDQYSFLIESIRLEDQQQGAFLVKRFLEGPQLVWNQTQRNIFNLKNLWDINNIADEHLIYLKDILGWTREYDGITLELSPQQLRRLLFNSISIWKTRGTEDALVNIITFVTKARARINNWFYHRWIVDETGLSHDGDDLDPWTSDETDVRTYNLRIVDDGTLNRKLIRNFAALMRPSGERVDITYLNFSDYFDDDDNSQWITYSWPEELIDLTLHDQPAYFDIIPQPMRSGYWKMTGRNNYDSVSVTPGYPSSFQFMISFDDYYAGLVMYPHSSGGVYVEVSTTNQSNMYTYAASQQVTFSAEQEFAIEVNHKTGFSTLSQFTTGNVTQSLIGPFNYPENGRLGIGGQYDPFLPDYSGGEVTSIRNLEYTLPNDTPLYVANGTATLDANTDAFMALAFTSNSGDWTDYMVSVAIQGTGWRWGVCFYAANENNYYAVYADLDNKWHLAKSVGGGITNIASALNRDSRPIYPGISYGLRVQITPEELTNRIVVYIDGVELINATDDSHTRGTVGFMRFNDSATVKIDNIEVMGLPATSDFVGLGS